MELQVRARRGLYRPFRGQLRERDGIGGDRIFQGAARIHALGRDRRRQNAEERIAGLREQRGVRGVQGRRSYDDSRKRRCGRAGDRDRRHRGEQRNVGDQTVRQERSEHLCDRAVHAGYRRADGGRRERERRADRMEHDDAGGIPHRVERYGRGTRAVSDR